MDECISNNGGCEDNCVNTEGSFRCSCPKGYDLSGNGKACQGIIKFVTNFIDIKFEVFIFSINTITSCYRIQNKMILKDQHKIKMAKNRKKL